MSDQHPRNVTVPKSVKLWDIAHQIEAATNAQHREARDRIADVCRRFCDDFPISSGKVTALADNMKEHARSLAAIEQDVIFASEQKSLLEGK